MDIEAVLQSWGFENGASGGGVGSVVGSLATAALLNAAFTPLHFAVAVYGTKVGPLATHPHTPCVCSLDHGAPSA